MRALALVVVLCGASLAGQVSPAPPEITQQFITNLLDRYAAADYTAVEAGLRAITDAKVFKSAFGKATLNLADAAKGSSNLGYDERVRRRLIAGTLALEVANRVGVTQQAEAVVIIETACKLVRTTATAQPAERAWHWAAIAILESMADGEALELQTSHARARIPDEPRFVLARAVATELRTFPTSRDDSPMDTDSTLALLTIARLQEAQKYPATRDEAHVRLGYFYLRLGRVEPALEQLRAVSPSSNDRYVRYLANLFEGRALERLDRLPEAIVAYRSATQAVSGAQTAEVQLAAALARHGDRAEAADIILRSVRSQSTVGDPWALYGQSDARFWPQILTSLRAGLR